MSDTELQQALGQAMRAQRKRLKLSQENFADAIDMHRAYYGAIERGLKNQTLGIIARVANGLGVTPAKLFGDAANRCSESGPGVIFSANPTRARWASSRSVEKVTRSSLRSYEQKPGQAPSFYLAVQQSLPWPRIGVGVIYPAALVVTTFAD